MLFSPIANDLDPHFDNIPFSCGTIDRVDLYDYLGLTIDSQLSFAHHVGKVISRIKPYVAIMGRLRYYLPTNCLKMIYYAYVHSRIHYLLPAYGSSAKINMGALELLHKKSLKYVFKLRFDCPTTEVYKKGISDLYTLTDHEMVMLLYKIKNNLIKTNFTVITRGEVTGRSTRQASNFEIAFTHLNYIKGSFFGKGFDLFNHLPLSIRNESSIGRFKTLSLRFLKARVP